MGRCRKKYLDCVKINCPGDGLMSGFMNSELLQCLIDGLLKNWCVVYRDDVVCGHYEVSSSTGAFYDL